MMFAAIWVADQLALGASLTSSLIYAALTFAISTAILVNRRRDGVVSRNLLLRQGLSRRDRRTVRRAIRRAEPSLDPILRQVEVEDAAVIARSYGWLALMLGLVGGVTLAWVIQDDLASTRLRLFELGTAAVLIAFVTWCLAAWIGARRFSRRPPN